MKKQGQSFVKIEAGYSMAEIEETIRNDYENRHTYCEYFNTVDGKAAYNDGDIFSIQFKSAWFLGGVSNYNTYGATFDVETGKKLNLMDVVSDDFSDFSDLQRVIYYRLESQYGSEVAQAFDEKYSTEKALKKVNFYVNEKGKVIVCFQTYELSYGAAGCLTVTLPSRF
ncbi:MAG: DUF3298 domain-containing protein [Lachnospiraceae bacterium]|nr:DUF3298 domain-containing protein [Lachnospiraceae bacterium]